MPSFALVWTEKQGDDEQIVKKEDCMYSQQTWQDLEYGKGGEVVVQVD